MAKRIIMSSRHHMVLLYQFYTVSHFYPTIVHMLDGILYQDYCRDGSISGPDNVKWTSNMLLLDGVPSEESPSLGQQPK